jgi:hypothetical protein
MSTTSSEPSISIDCDALIAAKRRHANRFREVVAFYRARGVSDRELIAALIAAPRLINPLKLGGKSR